MNTDEQDRRSVILKHLAPFLIAVLMGVAAIVFGEADDAPGLVLLGILIIAGAVAVRFQPALRTRSRVVGLILSVVAVTAIGSAFAGWLENNF